VREREEITFCSAKSFVALESTKSQQVGICFACMQIFIGFRLPKVFILEKS
jgi:hypothetical protein